MKKKLLQTLKNDYENTSDSNDRRNYQQMIANESKEIETMEEEITKIVEKCRMMEDALSEGFKYRCMNELKAVKGVLENTSDGASSAARDAKLLDGGAILLLNLILTDFNNCVKLNSY